MRWQSHAKVTQPHSPIQYVDGGHAGPLQPDELRKSRELTRGASGRHDSVLSMPNDPDSKPREYGDGDNYVQGGRVVGNRDLPASESIEQQNRDENGREVGAKCY